MRDNGGHAVALGRSMDDIFDTGPGQVFWAASDVGWVVGHSYIVYGPLLAGCTTVLYEGKPVGTPDPGAFWRVIAEHGVRTLFTAPTAFRAIRKEDPRAEHLAGHDLRRFAYLFLAGERLDPDTYHWAAEHLGRPVIDHWWQTESGWPIAANCMGLEPLPVKPGSPTRPVPGYRVKVLDPDWRARPGRRGARSPSAAPAAGVPADALGRRRALRALVPLGVPRPLRDGRRRLHRRDGYLWVMGRIDDVLNVAGHRLSTGAMEEVLAGHPDVAECAVIGAADELKGQVPVGFVVLKAGAERDPAELRDELVRAVRDRIGPVASFKEAFVVPRLPKTRSGKVLRGTMRSIADGRDYRVPSTIDDPAILDEIAAALARRAESRRARARGTRAAPPARRPAAPAAACARRPGSPPRRRRAGSARAGERRPPASCGRARQRARAPGSRSGRAARDCRRARTRLLSRSGA